ncbi:hypothetical protein BAE44_0006437, partial [Dichanthelium oligosanthes]
LAVSAKRFGSPGSVSLACRRPVGLRPLPRRLRPLAIRHHLPARQRRR